MIMALRAAAAIHILGRHVARMYGLRFGVRSAGANPPFGTAGVDIDLRIGYSYRSAITSAT